MFNIFWLVVSTRLKNISQIGSFPQVGVNMNKHLKPPPSFQYFLVGDWTL